jgi:hypothetical protein
MSKGKEVLKIESLMNDAILAEAKRLVLGIHGRLRTETPIDTGWAISNWLLAIGRSFEQPVGSKEKVDVSTADASRQTILAWNFSDGPVHNTNNVPYINDLNSGTSRQAPPGFVDAIIQSELAISNGKVLS